MNEDERRIIEIITELRDGILLLKSTNVTLETENARLKALLDPAKLAQIVVRVYCLPEDSRALELKEELTALFTEYFDTGTVVIESGRNVN